MSPAPNGFEEMLTPSEVAWIFGVHTRTVGQWARTGHLTPAWTAGGQRRYYATEIRALLDDGTPEGATPLA